MSLPVQSMKTAEGWELRQEIEDLISSGNTEPARRRLCELWACTTGPAAASFVISQFEQLRHKLTLLPYKLAILRSFTVEPIVPLLRAAAFTVGLQLEVYISDFNAYAQELLDEGSQLYRFAPDAVIFAVQTRDASPDLWRNYADLSPEHAAAEVRRVTENFRSWVATLRRYSQADLVVHALEVPATPSRGTLDSQSEASQSEAIQQINRELRALTRQHRGVYLLDYDALVARYGRAQWHDERKWLTVRMPIASQHLNHLAQEWLRFLHPLSGRVVKALVVDLDNTLWGGVIGEDGIEGIQVGPEYPGAAYQAVQRVMLDLFKRGILLAVCSKNDRQDAIEALEHHPGMLLRPAHFAAVRINWNNKVQSLQEIAAELSIGLDALAFLDDNPAEREQIRTDLPEVTVIELPTSRMDYAQTLRDSPVFERLSLSKEDNLRTEYYRSQQSRGELEWKCSSREDFYRSLQQEVEIAPLATSTLARIVQLTNKTNQFNLTTRRYTEQEIAELAADPGWHCFSLRVRDRYGDNGVVGVAITRESGEVCEIETLLLSCRVIGRTIETVFLSFLAEHARKQGATLLQGWFLPNKKNAPARDFYPSHRFALTEQNETGSLWSFDLAQGGPKCPDWVRLVVSDGGKG